jgi:hypothetical protein
MDQLSPTVMAPKQVLDDAHQRNMDLPTAPLASGASAVVSPAAGVSPVVVEAYLLLANLVAGRYIQGPREGEAIGLLPRLKREIENPLPQSTAAPTPLVVERV